MSDQADSLAAAFIEAEALLPGKYWMFTKGKTRPDEPLFAFAVFESEPLKEAADAIVTAEADCAVECVRLAVNALGLIKGGTA